MKATKTICLVAGKSGGHIIPALTKARQIVRANPAYQILFFSTNSPLDHAIIKQETIVHQHVPLSIPPRSRTPLGLLKTVWQFARSFKQSYAVLRTTQPEKIISMGGAVSIPVCLAGALLGIPIEIYELNARPGKAVQFLAPYADVIWLTYKQARDFLPQKKCLLTQYPVRFSEQDRHPEPTHERSFLGLNPNHVTILILGGSQGSIGINKLIKHWIEEYPLQVQSLQFIHQTGSHDTTDWQALYKHYGLTAYVFTYHHDMQHFYNAADIIICRAGAGTIAEALFFRKQCLIVPLKVDTTDHQLFNAQATAQTYPDLCTVLEQHTAERNIMIFIQSLQYLAHRLGKNI